MLRPYAFDVNGENLHASTWLPGRQGDVLHAQWRAAPSEAIAHQLNCEARRYSGIVGRALGQPVSGELTLSQAVFLDGGLRSQLAKVEAA